MKWRFPAFVNPLYGVVLADAYGKKSVQLFFGILTGEDLRGQWRNIIRANLFWWTYKSYAAIRDQPAKPRAFIARPLLVANPIVRNADGDENHKKQGSFLTCGPPNV